MYSFNRALNFKILVIRDIFAARDNKWDVYKRWTVLGAQWPVQWFTSRTIRMIEIILNVLYKSHSRRAERSSFEIIRLFLFFCCFFFAACYWGRSGKSFWGRLKTCGIKILKARKTEIWSRSKREANRSRSRRSSVHSGGVDQCFQTFPAEMWKKREHTETRGSSATVSQISSFSIRNVSTTASLWVLRLDARAERGDNTGPALALFSNAPAPAKNPYQLV